MLQFLNKNLPFRKIRSFFYWKFYDFKNPQKKRPYGIYCYVGRPGFGKTVSMVEKLTRLKIQYPKSKIYTNFGYKYQDGFVRSQDDLLRLKNGEDGIIFALDELQNTFNARNWNKFPPEMLSLITQNRKQSKMILCTAQSFSMIDKNFRLICNYIIECKTFFGRWVRQRAFLPEDYREHEGEYKPRVKSWKYSFIASNFIFNSYDTLQIIEGIFQEQEDQKKIKMKVPVIGEDAPSGRVADAGRG